MDFRKASQAHVVPHFTKGAAWNADDLIVMDHAEGCYVTDSEGKRYLDGLAGLFYEPRPRPGDLAAEASKQMERMAFYRTGLHARAGEQGGVDDRRRRSWRPRGRLLRVVGLRSRRVRPQVRPQLPRHGDEGRYKVISREWSYHGTTIAALAVTGVPKFRKHFLPMLWDGPRHVRNTHGDTADALASAKAVEDMILAGGRNRCLGHR